MVVAPFCKELSSASLSLVRVNGKLHNLLAVLNQYPALLTFAQDGSDMSPALQPWPRFFYPFRCLLRPNYIHPTPATAAVLAAQISSITRICSIYPPCNLYSTSRTEHITHLACDYTDSLRPCSLLGKDTYLKLHLSSCFTPPRCIWGSLAPSKT